MKSAQLWRPPFPVVGIGASAGGLEALKVFFASIADPSKWDGAVLVVQHLDAHRPSLLPEILAGVTILPVVTAENDTPLAQGKVYVVPPGYNLGLSGKCLKLTPLTSHRNSEQPVDHLFSSLAKVCGPGVVGIILSGDGVDGTAGIREIKAVGGLVMVQTPESARNVGMVESALSTGLADHILPPSAMPEVISLWRASRPFPAAVELTLPPPEMPGILDLVHARTGHDFTVYKTNTLLRRIQRRMSLASLSDLGAYQTFLQDHPLELDALFQDFLIGVTSFFRDKEAFQFLEDQVLPQLINERQGDQTLRIWVPGCSTGEEAYSLAMAVFDVLEISGLKLSIRIFATDMDARSISRARLGVYPRSAMAEMEPQRRQKYFSDESPETYRVKKQVRESLVFSVHDMTRDPPFSRLDLISCRNVLIYLGEGAQKKLLSDFNYGLRAGGYLFLGNSESLGELAGGYQLLGRKMKIYRKKVEGSISATSPLALPQSPLPPLPRSAKPDVPSLHRASLNYESLVNRALAHIFAPPAVLVDQEGDIHFLHGKTGAYLEPSSGEAVMNLKKMIRSEIRDPVVQVFQEAVSGLSVQSTQLNQEGRKSLISVIPIPLEAEGRFFLVVFNPESPSPGGALDPREPGGLFLPVEESLLLSLKMEVLARDEHILSTKEELQTSNEELRSSNEELQSLNEELQSANEELETSREELQSVNEELSSTNAELQDRVSELSRITGDMNNLLACTGIGTLFLDGNLRILRFTPPVTDLIRLIPGDIGRPLGDLAMDLGNYGTLVQDVQETLLTALPKDRVLRSRGGKWYQLGIRPYRTQDSLVEGAVVTFVNLAGKQEVQDGQV